MKEISIAISHSIISSMRQVLANLRVRKRLPMEDEMNKLILYYLLKDMNF